MSSVDTRLKYIWSYMTRYRKTGDAVWLQLAENCRFSEDPLEAAAAEKYMLKHWEDEHESCAS